MEKRIVVVNRKQNVIFAEVLREIAYLKIAGLDSDSVMRLLTRKWDFEDEEEIWALLDIHCELIDRMRELMYASGTSKKEVNKLLNDLICNVTYDVKLADPCDEMPHSRFLS